MESKNKSQKKKLTQLIWDEGIERFRIAGENSIVPFWKSCDLTKLVNMDGEGGLDNFVKKCEQREDLNPAINAFHLTKLGQDDNYYTCNFYRILDRIPPDIGDVSDSDGDRYAAGISNAD